MKAFQLYKGLDLYTVNLYGKRILWCRCGSAEGLDAGRHCLKKWGFRRCEDICWVKTNTDPSRKASTVRQDANAILQHTKVRSLYLVSKNCFQDEHELQDTLEVGHWLTVLIIRLLKIIWLSCAEFFERGPVIEMLHSKSESIDKQDEYKNIENNKHSRNDFANLIVYLLYSQMTQKAICQNLNIAQRLEISLGVWE